mmetsp:Transcript_84197/g.146208  ORF Transcript_84197/g.146208 Transcript_84197/m.146208 type:complete len:408 (+) Transcript_84197:113-1336(+)
MGLAHHPTSSRGAHAVYAALLFLVLLVARTDCRLRRGRTFLARSHDLRWTAAKGWAGEQQPGGKRKPGQGVAPQFTLADGSAPAPAYIPLAAVPTAFQPSPAPGGVAPAPAPAVAPIPAPPPPAKFPVIGSDECQVLQEAIVVEPRATCRHVIFQEGLDGCTCSMVLPASINPMPNNLYDPFAMDVPPDPDLPVPPMPPTVPPPGNPMQPYIAPMMAPECPFAKACAKANDFDCVGYNSFGFSEAHMAPYSPAASHLNQISCSYFMALRSEFRIPSKVESLGKILEKRKKVELSYQRSFVVPEVLDDYGDAIGGIPCAGRKIESTWKLFCEKRVSKKNWPCSTKYKSIMEREKCVGAPAPTGFLVNSTLGEMCPLECGFTKGHTMWPPYPADESGAATWKPWGLFKF